jgi:hypothetical protein
MNISYCDNACALNGFNFLDVGSLAYFLSGKWQQQRHMKQIRIPMPRNIPNPALNPTIIWSLIPEAL